MKEIKEYNADNLKRLKRWLEDMSLQNHTKYFEILVDGLKVIPKTNKLEDFDQYARWMDESVQSMRVLVYNTQNSHRAQVFEFRTSRYVEEVSDKLYPTRKPRLSEDEINVRVQQGLDEKLKKQTFTEMHKQNRDLIRRLEDAESYILKLEAKAEEKRTDNDFDLNGFLQKAALFVGNNPDIKEKLGGIDGLFGNTKQNTLSDRQNSEEPTVTFKKIDTKQQQETGYEREQDNTLCLKIPSTKLDSEKSQQLYDLVYFLSQQPEYIGMVHVLMKTEQSKLLTTVINNV